MSYLTLCILWTLYGLGLGAILGHIGRQGGSPWPH